MNKKFSNYLLLTILLLGIFNNHVFAYQYSVTLDTTPLVNGATNPYYIEFQLVDGDGIANNSVNISNFNFSSGSAVGAATLDGSASGSLLTGLSLADAFFFNSFYQEFLPGNTLSFTVDLSANYVDPTPDQFSFAILNNSLFEIPTFGPGNELFSIDFKQPLTFNTYAGLSGLGEPVLGEPSIQPVAPVPEPSTILLLGAGIGGMIFYRRRTKA